MNQPEHQQSAVSRLSDADLVEKFRSVKHPNNGGTQGPVAEREARAIETEMVRRGLMPDREDVIPDESAPSPDLESKSGEVEELPPGPGSATGDPEEELPA